MADTDLIPLVKGQRVWYVKANEEGTRPAVLLSDGVYEVQKLANGKLRQYAHLAYGTRDKDHALLGNENAQGPSQAQTHETTAPWDNTGAPGTWHLEGECPELHHAATTGEPVQQAP